MDIPYDAIALTIFLYLIHRSFHKVNFVGFVAISAILITINSYIIRTTGSNPLLVIVTMVTAFPILSYLFAQSVSGLKNKSQEPLQMPYYAPMQR